jgi:large subunit ribosomal protein L29
MKREEIVLLSNEDLTKRLKDFKDQMINLKLTHKMAPIENPMRITGLRKIIARLCTELTVRENMAKAEN